MTTIEEAQEYARQWFVREIARLQEEIRQMEAELAEAKRRPISRELATDTYTPKATRAEVADRTQLEQMAAEALAEHEAGLTIDLDAALEEEAARETAESEAGE